MKKLLSVLAFLVCIISIHAQTLSEKIDQFLNAYQKQNKLNGSVLVVKGSEILNKGYGYKNYENQELNSANSIYQIGSVTKQFTAVLILKLSEQKNLSLQDKLSKYYPNFPNAEKISIEQLLTHTSGLFNYTNDENFMKNNAALPLTEEQFINFQKEKALDFEPGEKFSYSNSGYMFLGYIIEKTSGMSYEKYVQQQVFVPLKMKNSGYNYIGLQNEHKTQPYQSFTSKQFNKAVLVHPSFSYAAGTIYSTTSDLYTWNQALLNNSIITNNSFSNATTARKNNYGFGLVIDSIYNKRRISHSGGINGYASHLLSIPEDTICIVVLNNLEIANAGRVASEVLKVLYNKPYTIPTEKIEISLPIETLQQYVGEYEITPAFKIIITLENNKLKAQATGQPQFDIFAMSENKFFLKVVEADIEFIKNAEGKVEKLILYQGGAKVPGIKK